MSAANDKPDRRVLFAHRKVEDDATVDAACQLLQDTLATLRPANDYNVIPGRDDYMHRAKAMGSASAWASSCAHVVMGEPRFHSFVTTDEYVGQWTKVMLESAIAHGRTVAWWNGQGVPGQAFRQVIGLVKRDPYNASQPYALLFAEAP